MRFTPDADGVVAIDGSDAEFRAVLDRLAPAVRAVVAHRVARVSDEAPVSLVVYADAAVEVGTAWAGVVAEQASADA
jgi:hypothetical protein